MFLLSLSIHVDFKHTIFTYGPLLYARNFELFYNHLFYASHFELRCRVPMYVVHDDFIGMSSRQSKNRSLGTEVIWPNMAIALNVMFELIFTFFQSKAYIN